MNKKLTPNSQNQIFAPLQNYGDAESQKTRQERILARRTRINNRIAKAKLEADGEITSIPSSLELLNQVEEKTSLLTRPITGTQKEKAARKVKDDGETLDPQIEESRKQLEQLILDGETLITNVKVAVEYREKIRQDRQEETRKERITRLRKEADECQQLYQGISENWMLAAKKVLPIELYEKIKSQQASCDDLLSKKDETIAALRREIEDNDYEYENNLEKYQNDMVLMGDRIDDHVEDLRSAFLNELELIENYNCHDRELLLQENQQEWLELLNSFEKMEHNFLEQRKEEALGKFQILNNLFASSKQEYRVLKHSMEDDLRVLIQEVEQVKVICQFNLEKMDYNLHILRRREAENRKMKNSMKRLLLKMQDRFVAKARAYRAQTDAAKKESILLIKEIRRMEYLCSRAGPRTVQTVAGDYYKYMDLWILNEEWARDKLVRLLDSEKYIYETQLGIDLPITRLTTLDERPPEVNCYILKTEYSPPTAPGMESAAEAEEMSEFISESGSRSDSAESVGLDTEEGKTVKKTNSPAAQKSLIFGDSDSISFLPGPEPDPVLQRRLMKHITKLICDQTGFIVEEKLRQIISPLINLEKQLVHIDSLLQALGVTNSSEMQLLAKYMARYSHITKGVLSATTFTEPQVSEMFVSRDESEASQSQSESNEKFDGAPTNDRILPSDSPTREPRKVSENMPLNSKEKKMDKPTTISPLGATSDFVLSKKSHVSQTKHSVSDSMLPIYRTEFEKRGDSSVHAYDTETEDETLSIEAVIEGVSSDQSLVKVLEQAGTYHDLDNLSGEDEIQYPRSEAFSFQSDEVSENSVMVYGDVTQSQNQPGNVLNPTTKKSMAITAQVPTSNFVEEGVKELFEETEESEASAETLEGVQIKDNNQQSILETSPGPKDMELYPKTEFFGIKALLGGQSKSIETVSIPSLPTTSVDSQEFMYIEPNDVLRALAAFCKDFNAKIKIELPSVEEAVNAKLAKMRFPDASAVSEYWNNFLTLVDSKSVELWDAIQYCFEQYSGALKKRNTCIEDIVKLYQQNLELSHLLKKHMKQGKYFSPGVPGYERFNSTNY